MKNDNEILGEYYYASGTISGSLDALSAEFSGYEKLPVRSRQPGNVLYRARRFGRYYVLKGLAPEYRDDPAIREYLSKEYQIGVQLDHPHIVRVNSLEEDPKAGLCIVMEYVDGQSLDQWLLPVLLIGLFCFWMHPDGKKFPVTLDSGQTVYAKVLSHWHHTVAFVCPSDTTKTWRDLPNVPSGDMVIPAHIRLRGFSYRVTELDSNAFDNCSNLTHIVFSEGLERIGCGAFSACNRLSDTLVIPRSLKVLESNAFDDCHSLTVLVWKALDCTTGTLPNLNDQFFYRCNSLKKAIVDDSVYVLPARIFYDMSWLEEIEIPNHIVEIPRDFAAFSYSLRDCRLPDSLHKISHGAFYMSSLERVVIPDKTELLGAYSFSYCRKLREVEIGSGVKRIGSYAFNDNVALQTMIIHCEELPTMLPNSLFNIPDSAVLYVPAQSVEKYRKHEVWGKFRRIEPISN